MKLIKISIAIISGSSGLCQAFAPKSTNVRSSVLHAESLEGWKIDGLIKPVNNFILIEKAKEQSQSESGILLSKSVSVVSNDCNIQLDYQL